ncbi:MAG: diguanylate cyclase [Synergistota bacterium]|nr:diguanylate cyclase [Synergistota bacterium]
MKEYNIYRILLGAAPLHNSDQKVIDVPSAAELIERKPLPGIVIIDGMKDSSSSEGLRALNELVDLRRSVEFCYAPVYLSRTMQQLDMLVDGVILNVKERLDEASSILKRGSRTKPEDLVDNHYLRLLTYMYVRGEQYMLSPICSPFSPWVYSYPEAALLVDSSSESSKLLKAEDLLGLERLRAFRFDKEMVMALKITDFLEENGYITRSSMVDRIRKCPKCKTGHLNYLDVCPNCGSIDFQKKTMIHCFVCGHVAPDTDFKKNMSFVCPKCGSVLRHLGSDYDHPLESHECNDCGSKFIEPDVKADCFFCNTRTVPGDLIVKNIYSYKLTEKGISAVRTGSMQMEIKLFDGQNNLIFNYFCTMTEWLREYRKRYPDEVFSLMGIRLSNLYEVQYSLGDESYQKLINELVSRIRAMVRTTDMTTSSAPDTFWVLLPKTPLNKSEIISQRIEALNDIIEGKTEYRIRIKAKCFEIPESEEGLSVKEHLEAFSEAL